MVTSLILWKVTHCLTQTWWLHPSIHVLHRFPHRCRFCPRCLKSTFPPLNTPFPFVFVRLWPSFPVFALLDVKLRHDDARLRSLHPSLPSRPRRRCHVRGPYTPFSARRLHLDAQSAPRAPRARPRAPPMVGKGAEPILVGHPRELAGTDDLGEMLHRGLYQGQSLADGGVVVSSGTYRSGCCSSRRITRSLLRRPGPRARKSLSPHRWRTGSGHSPMLF
jgi:hypothetical protein